MFLNANGEGAVKVIVPTNTLKSVRLTPLARRCVGKISAVQMNVGASTHYIIVADLVSATCCKAESGAQNISHLEDANEDKYEEDARRVASLVRGS